MSTTQERMGRPRKCWSLRVGAPGNYVTVFERRPGGGLSVRWWQPSGSNDAGRWCYRALGYSDRSAGEQTAKTIAAQLLSSTLATARGTATLADVVAVYEHDVANHAKGAGPREAKRRAAIWTAFFGAEYDCRLLDFPTMDRFVRERRAGAIIVPDYELGAAPSDRAIGADIEHLRAVLNHATRVVRPTGGRLLDENPIRGYQVPRNKNVRRPVATYDRFLAIMEHADTVDPQRLFGGFMLLIEGLGWRVSAICALRACDVELSASPSCPNGRIFKRAASDKEGREGWVPMSKPVRAGVDRIRAANTAIGDFPLFPAPRATTEIERGRIPKAWTRHHARALLTRAEKAAKLEALKGSDFHAYRRKWATERKHLPDADVAAAGAWADTRALKQSYQHSDAATLLAVMTEPTKLRDVGAVKKTADGA